jgi:hypothetical protein
MNLEKLLCMNKAHESSSSLEYSSNHIKSVAAVCAPSPEVILEIKDGHLVDEAWVRVVGHQVGLLEESKQVVHETVNVPFHYLNSILPLNEHLHNVFIISVPFDFLIIFISDFKLADPECLNNRLQIFDLTDRRGTQRKDAEAYTLLLHVLDQVAICVLPGRAMGLVYHEQDNP